MIRVKLAQEGHSQNPPSSQAAPAASPARRCWAIPGMTKGCLRSRHCGQKRSSTPSWHVPLVRHGRVGTALVRRFLRASLVWHALQHGTRSADPLGTASLVRQRGCDPSTMPDIGGRSEIMGTAFSRLLPWQGIARAATGMRSIHHARHRGEERDHGHGVLPAALLARHHACGTGDAIHRTIHTSVVGMGAWARRPPGGTPGTVRLVRNRGCDPSTMPDIGGRGEIMGTASARLLPWVRHRSCGTGEAIHPPSHASVVGACLVGTVSARRLPWVRHGSSRTGDAIHPPYLPTHHICRLIPWARHCLSRIGHAIHPQWFMTRTHQHGWYAPSLRAGPAQRLPSGAPLATFRDSHEVCPLRKYPECTRFAGRASGVTCEAMLGRGLSDRRAIKRCIDNKNNYKFTCFLTSRKSGACAYSF